MNRKLTKLLKSTYGSESPNRKNDFIQQVKMDPTWRRLHPISSFIDIHPTLMPLSAFMTAAAICVLIVVCALKGQNTPKPEEPPEIISKMTVTTSNSSESINTDDVVSAVAENSVTETFVSVSVEKDSQKTSYATEKGLLNNSEDIPHVSEEKSTSSAISSVNAASSAVETTVSSIYYTQLFRHDYTARELNDNETLKYGYPDKFLLRDQFKLKIEAESSEFADILIEHLNGLTDSDISENAMGLVLAWNEPEIIEGITTNIEYTAYEGKPWTICEVTVSKVHHFNCSSDNGYKVINKGDKINIAMPGGYMKLSEYISLNPDDAQFRDWTENEINSTVIYEAGSNQNEPRIGDSFAYFLENCNIDLPIENLYIRSGFGDVSQFTVNGSCFASCNSNYADYKFYKSRISEDTIWEYFYDPDSSRCIAFRDESVLLSGCVSCYSIDSDGKVNYLDSFLTDDGFFPFCEPYGEEQIYVHNETEVVGRYYRLTWCDEGVTLKYCVDELHSDEDEFEIINFSIPK